MKLYQYDALRGKLIRAPILRSFGDVRAPEETLRWVDDVAEWPFDRILPSHFAGPIKAGPADFREAFAWLRSPGKGLKLACVDWETLDGLNELIETQKLGAKRVADYKAGCD